MSFTDILYIPFMALAVLIYFVTPGKHRWKALLVISAVFYATWGIGKLPIILAESWAAWMAARRITVRYRQADEKARLCTDRQEAKKIRDQAKKAGKADLTAAAALLIGFLVFLKAGSLMGDALAGKISIIVPLGISYYTLSLVGHVADCYWRKDSAVENYFRFALFALYFPKILEGPISRYRDLGEQLTAPHAFSYDRMCRGIWLIMWGYFQKLVIADRAAIIVNEIFGHHRLYHGSMLLTAALLSSVQIYCDFAGCMNIACGFSEILDIRLEKNFNHPFFAETAAEFWRRWHITLGTWFRDYVYMPVSVSPWLMKTAGRLRAKFGRNTAKKITVIIPLLIVWLLTGLWHGTGWNYIVWGLYWGILIIMGTLFAPGYRRIVQLLHIDPEGWGYHTFRKVRTFLIFTAGRIITVPHDLGVSLSIMKRILLSFAPWELVNGKLYELGLDRPNLHLLVLCIVLLWLVGRYEEKASVRDWVASRGIVLRWILLYGLLFAVLIFGIYGPAYEASDFIYMNF